MQNTITTGRRSIGKAPLHDIINVSEFSLTSDQPLKTPSGRSAVGGGNRFNNSTISLTKPPKPVVVPEYELSRRDFDIIRQYEEDEGYGVGFCINQFSSGEITAGCYSRAVRKAPPVPEKRIISTKWSRASKKKIRRAVECNRDSSGLQFKSFLTLTFDAKLPHVKTNPDGTVCHLYAKSELERFLNTLKKRYDRAYEKTNNPNYYFAYIWVSEIQTLTTNNIHFHILFTVPFIPFQYINKTWGNGGTNIKKVSNPAHAANYMTKYMQKDSSPVAGHRYGMTQNLTKTIKPLRSDYYGRHSRSVFLKAVDILKHKIELNGGRVFDWGLFIPAPERPRNYRDKAGTLQVTRGTSRHISHLLLSSFADLPCTYPDLPF